MKLFYGWVIVAVGIVVGCVGMGGLMSFGVFLQPMAASLGWSRAGISTGSALAFLSMGIGGFIWGRLYDRCGGPGWRAAAGPWPHRDRLPRGSAS